MALKHFVFPIGLTYDGKKEINPDTYAFNFVSDEPVAWKAGQSAVFQLRLADKHSVFRPYAIASAPGERVITIATKISKDSQDPFKKALLKLKKGDKAYLRGPLGKTYIDSYDKEYAFLTTGIGITPFRSILKQLVMDGQLDTKITLFFVGNKDSHHFKEEINALKPVLRNFDIEYIYKPERITGQVLEDKLGDDIKKTSFFISGSPALIRTYRRTLLGLGVKRKDIKSITFYKFNAKSNKGVAIKAVKAE